MKLRSPEPVLSRASVAADNVMVASLAGGTCGVAPK